jgi:hypothetical protein
MLNTQQLYDQANAMYAQRDANVRAYLDNQYQKRFADTPNLDMVQATGDSVLSSFFNRPEYMIQYGENNNQIDPRQRFQFDPGYQFAVDESMLQTQKGAAAKGLLESGSLLRELVRQNYGMADQNYNRWQQNQYNTLNNYQNRLAALAGIGPSVNGATQAMQAGQSSAQAAQNTSQQLAGIYSNLGSGALSARTNIGAQGMKSYTDAGIATGQLQGQQAQALGQGVGSLLGSFF